MESENQQTASIPKLNLADKILSEQRKVASKRRQRPTAKKDFKSIMPKISGLVGQVIEENKKQSSEEPQKPAAIEIELQEPSQTVPVPEQKTPLNEEEPTIASKIELQPAEPVEIKQLTEEIIEEPAVVPLEIQLDIETEQTEEIEDTEDEKELIVLIEDIDEETYKSATERSTEHFVTDLDEQLDMDLESIIEHKNVPQSGFEVISEKIVYTDDSPAPVSPRPLSPAASGIIKNAGHLNKNQQDIISEIVRNDINIFCKAS